MKTNVSANEICGRTLGAACFTGFGALWLVLGLAAGERLNALNFTLVGAGISLLATAAVSTYRAGASLPRRPANPQQGRVFAWTNAVQWVLIALTVYVLGRARQEAYITPAIAAIVALHFLPLAQTFRYRPHYVTAAAMLIWTATVLLTQRPDAWQTLTALGAGLVLWASAAMTLLLARRRLAEGAVTSERLPHAA